MDKSKGPRSVQGWEFQPTSVVDQWAAVKPGLQTLRATTNYLGTLEIGRQSPLSQEPGFATQGMPVSVALKLIRLNGKDPLVAAIRKLVYELSHDSQLSHSTYEALEAVERILDDA